MSVTDEIKERLDIVEVISNYVQLKKAGRSYKGLCPFHSEKTPSFVVFPDGQSWHCFGACNTGGDVFSFVMKRENLDFGEALEMLAARAGVELKPRDTEATGDQQHIERLREIITSAATYFNYLLVRSDEAELGRDYLDRRGLKPETWEAWQLGYSLDSWDVLKNRLVAKGYSPEELEEVGLVIRREDGSGYYDRFRGRLMIPIRDTRGRTIGFGARVLREDSERPQPKYINSPQSPLFDKSSVLYGLDVAKKSIRDADLAVMVEGYMDVLMSHQQGVSNVVAGMGTAMTEAQMRQLKRFTNNITLALDPDAAGDHATIRGLETARQTLEREWDAVIGPSGLVRQESRLKAQLRIATLPDGLDPDELALDDPEKWKRVIASARPIVDYYLTLVLQEEDLSSARGKANVVARMAPLIQEIGDPVERSHYTQIVARKIQTDERLVVEQIRNLGRKEQKQSRRGADVAEAHDKSELSPESELATLATFGMEEHILGCLLSRPDLLAQLDSEMIELQVPPLTTEDFTQPENRGVLSALQSPLAASEEWTTDAVLERVPAVLRTRCDALLIHVLSEPALPDEKITKDLGDSLLRLRARHLLDQNRQLQRLVEESETGIRDSSAREYHELIGLCSVQLARIQRLLNGRTMAGILAQAKAKKSG